MRFPWQRKPSDVEMDLAAAAEAEQEALQRWPEVREAAEKALRLQYRNGFGEAITRAMGGK